MEIHLDDLIGTQRDIAEVIGIENYIKLCKAFGGDTVDTRSFHRAFGFYGCAIH